ncbi:MAG: flagellar export protein FliJ [Spirochaetes bacterium]|nr:flagellar export protein FliJ [Spirochaetota bacterium]
MSKFRFSLEKVLDFRKREEDKQKNELAKVQGKINRQYAIINELNDRRGTLIRKDEVKSLYTAAEVVLKKMQFSGIDSRMTGSRRRIRSMEFELEQARIRYTKARKEKMAIEKVKEKKYKEFLKQEQRREIKELSEIAEQIHYRNNKNNG